MVLGKGAAAACGALDAGSDAAHGAHGRMSVADGETERGRGYPASGSDAAVMGRERAGMVESVRTSA